MPKTGIAYLLAMCVFLIVVAGCGGQAISPKSPPPAATSPESTVNAFFDAVKANDFSKAGRHMAKAHTAFFGVAPNAVGQDIKETIFKSAPRVVSHSIEEIKEIDSSHKTCKVTLTCMTIPNPPLQPTQYTRRQEFLLVMENSEWKVDYSKTLRAYPVEKQWSWNIQGGNLHVSDAIFTETPEGMAMSFYITNNTKYTVHLGWGAEPVYRLATDKGAWSEEGRCVKIPAGRKQIITRVFDGASGKVRKVTVGGVFFNNGANKPLQTAGDVVSFEVPSSQGRRACSPK